MLPLGERRPAIPDYTLIRLIGSGSYGEVWLARGLTGIFRALKVVWRDRFRSDAPFDREFRGLQRFASLSLAEPRQLAVLHVGRDPSGEFFYYVMEVADDRRTGTAIDPDTYEPHTFRVAAALEVPAEKVIQWGIDLTGALSTLHRHGLVHRDIKPSNIIVVAGIPKLADIGLVAEVGEARTYVGTPGFIAPEGPGGPSSDVYALGKVLYELATGQDQSEFPSVPAEVAAREDRVLWFGLNEVILCACESNPARRYASAEAMGADLRLLLAAKSPRLRRAERQRQQWGRALALILPALVVAGVFAVRERAANRRLAVEIHRTAIERAGLTLEGGRLGEARDLLRRAEGASIDGLERRVLLRQAVGDQPEVEFPAGPGPVDGLAFDPEGQQLAVLYWDDALTLQVHEWPSGRLQWSATQVVELGGFVGSSQVLATVSTNLLEPSRRLALLTREGVAAGIDGRHLPAGNAGPGILVGARWEPGWRVGAWEPVSGRWSGWGPSPPPAEWLTNRVAVRLAAGRPRALLLGGSGDGDSYVTELRMVDPGGPAPFRFRWPGRTVEPGAAALHPREDWVAVVFAQDGLIRLLDARTGTELSHQPHAGAVVLGFSPDGRWLVSAGADETVRLFEVDARARALRPTRSYLGHGAPVTELAWRPDSKGFASGDSAGVVRTWTGSESRSPGEVEAWPGFKAGGQPGQVAVTVDEEFLAISRAADEIALVSGPALQLQRTVRGPHLPLAFTADSRHLWAVAGSNLVEVTTATGTVRPVAPFFPDGAMVQLAWGAARGHRAMGVDGRNRLALWTWDGGTVERTRVVEGLDPADPVIDAAFDPTLRQAVTCAEREVVVHDLVTGQTRRVPIEDVAPVKAVCFLGGPDRLLVGLDRKALLDVNLRRDPPTVREVTSPLNRHLLLVDIPEHDRVVAAGEDGLLAFFRRTDLAPMGRLRHRGLRESPERHLPARLVWLPRAERLIGLTEEGRLVRW